MKNLLIYFVLLLSCAAQAQLPAVSGFGNRNTKEQLISLIAHDRLSPPQDTTFTKLGYAIRAGESYYGNGTWWTRMATGPGVGYINPMTTLGDIIKAGASGIQQRLAGNATTIGKILRSIGDGTNVTSLDWATESKYIPNAELPGDVIVPALNGRDITNQHTTATYADGIVTGCVVSYSGANLVYRVNSPCVYNINGTQYTLPSTTNVTIPDGTASAGEFRTDAIVVTTSSTATSVLGDNSISGVGESAQADPATQFLLSYVRIDEANTTPTGIGVTVVRDEGSGGEWTISKTLTSTDNYATNPFHGTISQRITGANSGQYMQWIAPAVQSKSSFTTLLLYIRNNSALANVRNLTVTLRNGNATQVGNGINLTTYGYSKTALSSYQTIAIPMSAFAGADAFDRIRITNTQVGGTVNFQIDYVQLQSGIVAPPTNPTQPTITTVSATTGAYTATAPGGAINIVGSNGISTSISGSILTVSGSGLTGLYVPLSFSGDKTVILNNYRFEIESSTADASTHIIQNTTDLFFIAATDATHFDQFQINSSGTAFIHTNSGIVNRLSISDTVSFDNGADTLQFELKNIPYGGGFDKVVAYNSLTGRLGYTTVGGGGVGGAFISSNGTTAITADVIINLAAHTFVLGNMASSYVAISSTLFATNITDGVTNSAISNDAEQAQMSSNNEAATAFNQIRVNQSGLLVTLSTGNTFVYAADYSAAYTSRSLIDKGYFEANTNSVSSGSGAPGSTPTKIGDFYIDTTAFKLYFAKGISSSADWIIAN